MYYAFKNGKSNAKDGFLSLLPKKRDAVKAFVKKLAVYGKEYRPVDKVQWPLKRYTYGEYKARPHRFFFFQAGGNNLIFFDYAYKDQDTLGDNVYRRIENLKNEFEREFLKRYENT